MRKREAALRVLERVGGCLSMMFTDVNLAGTMDGITPAHFARRRFPGLHVVVTSGAVQSEALPAGAAAVIASQRVRPLAGPMTGSAKQSRRLRWQRRLLRRAARSSQ
jgi:hypothetical protein